MALGHPLALVPCLIFFINRRLILFRVQIVMVNYAMVTMKIHWYQVSVVWMENYWKMSYWSLEEGGILYC